MKRSVYFLLCLFPLLLAAQSRLTQKKQMALRKLNYAQMALQTLYIDSLDADELVDAALEGMVSKLDPHTSYTNAEETRKLNEPLTGGFEGIGVQFNILRDTLVVIQTVSKGPSEKVGILPGDRIVSVGDTAIAGVKMPRDKMMKLLRGPKGTVAELGIIRKGVDKKITFNVVRDKIPIHTLDAAYMIAPEIGLIRLSSFGKTSHEEFLKAIENLRAQGMKHLIFDLQQNGGGFLDAAAEIASEFLPDGTKLVYTDGRAIPHQEWTSQGNHQCLEGRVIVLVDEYTASASEIVSGAIQDNDRGLIVGRRTFGKGLVQRAVSLPDGSMLRVTISHYFTPSGRCIQKPYKKGQAKEYQQDVSNRYKDGSLMHLDSIHFPDSLKYKTLNLQRTVYGGGGIMPDRFVPLDTTRYTPLYRNLSLRNCILEQYLSHQDKHRKELKQVYPDFKTFKENFQTPEALLDSIIAEGKRQKVEAKDAEEEQLTRQQLSLTVKALTARDLWDLSEYFAIINEQDPMVSLAMQLMKNPPLDLPLSMPDKKMVKEDKKKGKSKK